MSTTRLAIYEEESKRVFETLFVDYAKDAANLVMIKNMLTGRGLNARLFDDCSHHVYVFSQHKYIGLLGSEAKAFNEYQKKFEAEAYLHLGLFYLGERNNERFRESKSILHIGEIDIKRALACLIKAATLESASFETKHQAIERLNQCFYLQSHISVNQPAYYNGNFAGFRPQDIRVPSTLDKALFDEIKLKAAVQAMEWKEAPIALKNHVEKFGLYYLARLEYIQNSTKGFKGDAKAADAYVKKQKPDGKTFQKELFELIKLFPIEKRMRLLEEALNVSSNLGKIFDVKPGIFQSNMRKEIETYLISLRAAQTATVAQAPRQVIAASGAPDRKIPAVPSPAVHTTAVAARAQRAHVVPVRAASAAAGVASKAVRREEKKKVDAARIIADDLEEKLSHNEVHLRENYPYYLTRIQNGEVNCKKFVAELGLDDTREFQENLFSYIKLLPREQQRELLDQALTVDLKTKKPNTNLAKIFSISGFRESAEKSMIIKLNNYYQSLPLVAVDPASIRYQPATRSPFDIDASQSVAVPPLAPLPTAAAASSTDSHVGASLAAAQQLAPASPAAPSSETKLQSRPAPPVTPAAIASTPAPAGTASDVEMQPLDENSQNVRPRSGSKP